MPLAHSKLRIIHYLPLFLTAVCGAVELPKLQVTEVLSGLHRPTFVTNAGDDSQRLFVTEQTGTIRVIADGKLLEQPFLDISGKITRIDPLCCDERGLLSVAFPPGYAQSGRFYVYYTGDRNEIFISRFHVSADDPNRADPDSEEILQRFEHEYENHFGGQLAFKPADRKLYFSIGDGAGGGNPLRSAQNPNLPYGKVWRFDAEGGNLELEMYSLGLRNPWRFSFDRLSSDLFIGDVGEDRWEEVNRQPHGAVGLNFGWSAFEGPRCFEASECGKPGFTPPLFAYDHNTGCSVTSGYVYRGWLSAELQGTYLHGDFCRGKIWGTVRVGEGWSTQLLLDENGHNWSAFGEDEWGEVYVLDYVPGTLYHVEIATEPPPDPEENL
jgi:glucose/arabinose dehydrogenase